MVKLFVLSSALCVSLVLSVGIKYSQVCIEFGSNLGEKVPSRVQYLFNKSNLNVVISTGLDNDVIESKYKTLFLSFGNTTLSEYYINLNKIDNEGYQIISKVNISKTSNTLIVTNGKPMKHDDSFELSFDTDRIHYGAVVGTYAVLEILGFAFLHPMDPIIVASTVNYLVYKGDKLGNLDDINIIEAPFWPMRTWHIHTQHPLEFTEVLNGYDIPMFTSDTDESVDSYTNVGDEHRCLPNEYCESWDSMFESLDGLFEWLVANKQNRVEVLLLGSPKWDIINNLTTGSIRQERLKAINQLCHDFGLIIGADLPIANRQQHGWKMINVFDNFTQQTQDIITHVNWAFEAHYDFISTESGLSEFTKPSCDLMLDLFNVFTKHVRKVWHRQALTKVHCSTSQYCNEVDDSGQLKYPDPRTGLPINFNFLPTYADDGLGVMPHTVQVYGFQDPSANSYGNENFTYMSEYMNYEASLNKRYVLYYGETGYWVNVDIDVPLFLPLSGQRRLSDLRYTARKEHAGKFKISGQMNFESGWEFGFYISNAITARAAWNPLIDIDDDWDAYALALKDLLHPFGDYTDRFVTLIINLSKSQSNIMIYSIVNDKPSVNLQKLSGHAYMSGSDTWADLERMLGVSITQPDKIHLQETNDPDWKYIMPLLKEMESIFQNHSKLFNEIVQDASSQQANVILSSQLLKYLQEIAWCVDILARRASHNVMLYTAQDPSTSYENRMSLLRRGRVYLTETESIMHRLVDTFRVPADRISAWRPGPTVYPFGYVWAARTLYYFWRDQGIVEAKTTMAAYSPCYLNREEPIELSLGWMKVVEQMIRLKMKKDAKNDTTSATSLLADCLAPPLREFKFPRDL